MTDSTSLLWQRKRSKWIWKFEPINNYLYNFLLDRLTWTKLRNPTTWLCGSWQRRQYMAIHLLFITPAPGTDPTESTTGSHDAVWVHVCSASTILMVLLEVWVDGAIHSECTFYSQTQWIPWTTCMQKKFHHKSTWIRINYFMAEISQLRWCHSYEGPLSRDQLCWSHVQMCRFILSLINLTNTFHIEKPPITCI